MAQRPTKRPSTQQPTPLDEAYALLKIGQRDTALLVLREYTRDHPHDAEGWWLVANALEDPAEVHKALLRALRENPDHKRAAFKLALLTQETGDPTLRREPTQKYRQRPAEVESNARVTQQSRVLRANRPLDADLEAIPRRESRQPARRVSPPSADVGRRTPARAKSTRENSSRTLVILSLILSVLLISLMIVMLIVINRSTPAPVVPTIEPTPNLTPQVAFEPTEFSGSNYTAALDYVYDSVSAPPCEAWTINGRVDAPSETSGQQVTDMVIRIVGEQSTLDEVFDVSAIGRYRAEILPQSNAINIYIYDAESVALGGIVNVRLGTDAIPTCAVEIDFNRAGR